MQKNIELKYYYIKTFYANGGARSQIELMRYFAKCCVESANENFINTN